VEADATVHRPTVRKVVSNLHGPGLCAAVVKTAKIVAPKKPGRADYTVPKAYRPISLLPTMSKSHEVIVAARLFYLAERYSLLPTN